MSDDDPDFKAFARSWVGNDPRIGQLTTDQSDTLVAKLAQALDRRRQEESKRRDQEGQLTLSLASDCLASPATLGETLNQMADVIEEQAPNFR